MMVMAVEKSSRKQMLACVGELKGGRWSLLVDVGALLLFAPLSGTTRSDHFLRLQRMQTQSPHIRMHACVLVL